VTRGTARRAIRTAATRAPTLTYAVVGAAASASAPLPSAGRLPLILPALGARELRTARRRLRSSEWKSRALGVVMNTATADPTFPQVDMDGPLPDPSRPTVFVSLHVGAMAAIAAVLQQLPNEVVALHRMDWRMPSNVVGVYVARTEVARVAGFHRALVTLRQGGHVFMPIEGQSVRVSLFGRPFLLTRGPFALARLTGAPIVLLFGRWRGGRARIFVGRPTAAGPDEQAMALAVSREIELYFRSYPGEVTDRLITGLIDGQQPLPDL
jgi:hypothetical protein